MIIAASLALAAVPAGPASAPVVEALARANAALDYAGTCASTPEEEESFLRLNGRATEITLEADALFGPLLAATFEQMQNRPGESPQGCGAAAAALIREAPARVDAAAAALADQVSLMPGLWIGTMHVCGATIAPSPKVPGRFDDDVTLVLPTELRQRLSDESALHVDLPIALRLDGRVIVAPIVREP